MEITSLIGALPSVLPIIMVADSFINVNTLPILTIYSREMSIVISVNYRKL